MTLSRIVTIMNWFQTLSKPIPFFLLFLFTFILQLVCLIYDLDFVHGLFIINPILFWFAVVRWKQSQLDMDPDWILIGSILIETVLIVIYSPVGRVGVSYSEAKLLLFSVRILSMLNAATNDVNLFYLSLPSIIVLLYSIFDTQYIHICLVSVESIIFMYYLERKSLTGLFIVIMDSLRLFQRYYWRKFILRGFGGGQIIQLLNPFGIYTERGANILLQVITDFFTLLVLYCLCISILSQINKIK